MIQDGETWARMPIFSIFVLLGFKDDEKGRGFAVLPWGSGRSSIGPIQKAGLEFFYYHANHQGSITHLTDSSGTASISYVYDSYGRPLSVFESVLPPGHASLTLTPPDSSASPL